MFEPETPQKVRRITIAMPLSEPYIDLRLSIYSVARESGFSD